jgi:hypothetical protein
MTGGVSLCQAADFATKELAAAGYTFEVSEAMLRRVKTLNSATASLGRPISLEDVEVTNPRGRPTILPIEVELEIVEWVRLTTQLEFPPSKELFIEEINIALERAGLEFRFEVDKSAMQWVTRFMPRHGMKCVVESPLGGTAP